MISSFYERIVGGSPPPETNKPKILCVGLVCLDIVQTVENFPEEDTDSRCVDYRWQRGGNASNNCTVLSQLDSLPEFFGTLSADHHLNFLKDDMIKYRIGFSNCPKVEGAGCPISTVILSRSSGSRTILHHRNPNFPELSLEDFEKLNLDNYSWVHFEGRNVPTVLSMMQHIEAYNCFLNEGENSDRSTITISVELEKDKPELLDLLPYADVAFISKDFAQSRGYNNMSETLRNIVRDVKSGATIICAWGDRGAMAKTPDGIIVQSPAFPPSKIVDSLGAGDTFIAAVIHYLNHAKLTSTDITEDVAHGSKGDESKSEDIKEKIVTERIITHNRNIESLEFSKTEFIDQSVLLSAVTFACRMAGMKIGFQGYEDLQTGSREFLQRTSSVKQF